VHHAYEQAVEHLAKLDLSQEVVLFAPVDVSHCDK
jgi:hypothetical protein